MATWNDVQVGDWVRGKDDALWGVKERKENDLGRGYFVMGRKGKDDFVATVFLDAAAPEIVRTADEMVTTAVAVAQDVLGAKVLHVERGSEPYACPPEFDEPGTMLSHLFLLHGARWEQQREPDQTLSALNAQHAALHKSRGDGYVHHQHTPDYLVRNRS